MIDTGCTVNIVDERVARDLQYRETIQSTEVTYFVGANGQPLEVLKQIVFPLGVMGTYWFHRWFVVRDLMYDFVLGAETLSLHLAHIS